MPLKAVPLAGLTRCPEAAATRPAAKIRNPFEEPEREVRLTIHTLSLIQGEG